MLTITRDLRLALAEFNAGVTRARREYDLHPRENSCPHNHNCPNRKTT